MSRFLISRAIGLIFVLFCVTFLTFICGYLAPGDPIRVMMGQHFIPSAYIHLKHEYGLDLPWWQQYYTFVMNALHGTFGYSFQYPGTPAWNLLKQGLPSSIELGLEVLIVQVVLGIPTGIMAALRANTRTDTTITFIAILLLSLPDIFLIMLFQVTMVWLYSHDLPSLPVSGWDGWQARIGPVMITATTGFGYFTRLTRTTMLEALEQDYVRTARMKGLREKTVVYRHVLRNAFLPLITLLAPSLAFIVTGIFITEQFFNIPGVSSLTLTAINQRDFPIVQATTVLTAVTVVFCNAIADLFYAVVDPRIRLE
jgi:ABC-type dipeptide/oligopeptide/nickel transport system permease component